MNSGAFSLENNALLRLTKHTSSIALPKHRRDIINFITFINR